MGACRSRPFWGHNLTFKKSPIFQPAQKEPNLRNLAPYEKLIFLQGEKKLSFSTRCFKKGHFNTYNNFYVGCNSDAFERFSIVQRCSKLIGSEISILALYAMRFGRSYCSSRNIILVTGSQLRSHLT